MCVSEDHSWGGRLPLTVRTRLVCALRLVVDSGTCILLCKELLELLQPEGAGVASQQKAHLGTSLMKAMKAYTSRVRHRLILQPAACVAPTQGLGHVCVHLQRSRVLDQELSTFLNSQALAGWASHIEWPSEPSSPECAAGVFGIACEMCYIVAEAFAQSCRDGGGRARDEVGYEATKEA